MDRTWVRWSVLGMVAVLQIGGAILRGRLLSGDDGAGVERVPAPPPATAAGPRPRAEPPGAQARAPVEHPGVVGESVTVDGMRTLVGAPEFVSRIGPTQSAGYLAVRVTVANTGDRPQLHSNVQWLVRTPDGQIRNPELVFRGRRVELGMDALAPGAGVSRRLYFDIGARRGEFSLVFKPVLGGPSRVVWRLLLA